MRARHSRPATGSATRCTCSVSASRAKHVVKVMSFEHTMLAHRRGHSLEDAADY